MPENDAVVLQPDAYPFAAEILRVEGGGTLIELGCGCTQDVSAAGRGLDLIGVGVAEDLGSCPAHHLFAHWFEHNFESGRLSPPAELDLNGAGILCLNVVERMAHTPALLETVADWLERASFALLSAAGRDLAGSRFTIAPGESGKIRQWGLPEFRELMKRFGIDEWASGLTVNNSRDRQKTTMAVLGRRKGWKSRKPAKTFRVLAIVCAYNEADIIEHTLDYLTSQGIQVVLLDNWSTDSTEQKAQAFLGKGLLRIERFPEAGDTGTYDWHNLLRRVEEVASDAEADWIIHHDADEIRCSPWRELNLRQALHQVDQEGFNCINHTCLVFHPTAESEAMGARVPEGFRYFEFGKRPGHFAQWKAWKKQPSRVSLADSGGHDVMFPGRKVYPLRFLLKPYPIRSQEHGRRKVFAERLGRFNPSERQHRGWHTQYDVFLEKQSFVRDPKDLMLFDSDRFEEEYLTERLTRIGISR